MSERSPRRRVVFPETESGGYSEADQPLPLDDFETSEAPQQDPERAEHELQAHEVLSGFQMYRTDVREGAADFMTGVQRKVAETKNLLSSPKNAYFELRRDMKQRKYDRISAKQDASKFEFINRHRDRKAEKAYGKLQDHEARLQGHNNMMQDRLDRVDSKGNERQEAVEQRRKELMEERVKAMERKLIREERRARRRELAQDRSLSHAERERSVHRFTKEDMARIRKAARVAFQINTERNETYAAA